MKKISVPESMSTELEKFVSDKAISLEVVTQDGDLKIEVCGEERLEGGVSTLYSVGWVSCATARAIAGKLAITLGQMGEMLDHLNIKVKQCGLGCF